MSRLRVLLSVAAAATAVACATAPVTGRRTLNLLSSDQETKLGDDAFHEVMAKEKESTDPAKREVVQRVGQKIAAATGEKDWKWEFRVIESEQANAFCLPGGKVCFYTGIFPYTKDEDGIATVMGHEVAHATAHHGNERVSQQMIVQGGLTAAGVAVGMKNPSLAAPLMGLLGAGATVGVILPFSRKQEAEADEIGLTYMARAGYDPRHAVEFWERFSKASEGKAPPEFLSTHPANETRIANLKKLLPEALKEYSKATGKPVETPPAGPAGPGGKKS